MSNSDLSSSSPPSQQQQQQPCLLRRTAPLQKQWTWSPDAYREETWLRRKERWKRRTKSVTDEDVDELRACIELGFEFDSPDLDKRLCDTLPALELYAAVNKQYNDVASKSASSLSTSSESDLCSSPASDASLTIFSPGDDPETVKSRLKRWAQVVACSIRPSRLKNCGRDID